MKLACFETRNFLDCDADYQMLKLKLQAEVLASQIQDVIKPIREWIVKTFNDICKWLCPIITQNSKVLHLSVYGNKRRTRKKNRKRLLKG